MRTNVRTDFTLLLFIKLNFLIKMADAPNSVGSRN